MHRRINWWNRLSADARRRAAAVVVAVVALLVVGGSLAYAATGGQSTTVIACGDGSDLLVHPGGTWNCATPAVSPSGSPSPSPSTSASPSPSSSPSPSTSPSASPSPSPTQTTPSPSPSPSTSGPCPVAGRNVPGAADPWGGCWPGPSTAGLPAGTVLTDYTGPCTITAAGTVIDHKHVTCSTLSIKAANVVIRNSWMDGVDIDDGDSGSASFTITDSKVSNGGRAQCACIGYHDFTATRVEVVGGNRGMYCVNNCTIVDSWVHGQVLIDLQHGSGIREEQNGQIRHNVLTCDYVVPAGVNTERSCSSPLTGYADFAPINHNTIYRNLFLASPYSSYCMYGGATQGKPFSGNALNGTYQVIQENVFQRGANGRCGDYGPITDFNLGGAGNVYLGNRWDSGEPLTNSDV